MRRKDREIDENFAYSVIDKSEYGVISMIGKDGMYLNLVKRGI